jgi:adenosylmethionine-8-amino-7-oxononanoate aminotransferase
VSSALGPHATTSDDLRARDREHVWHPYGPMPGRVDPLVVASARGVRLTLDDGRELVDAMSSWWAAVHGYRHPALDAAVRTAADEYSHVMFGGLTHDPAVRLATRLVEITPEPLRHVFLADSGSVSVEVAVKMCLQYQRARGRPGRTRMMTWRGGYHGDTFAAMSVCDPDGGMHSLWQGFLPEQVFADVPPSSYAPEYDEHLAAVAAAHADELAGIIVEPVVQGAGGMRFHDPRHLVALREIADRHDLVLIFDEIATGFGRTGELFAADHAGVAPDVLCVGKALTGGYLTLAAALCTPAVAEAVSDERGGGGLMHGPTFMGNPLASRVALASVEELLRRDWRAEVAGIGDVLREGLEPARRVPGVRDVRVLGAIGVVQLDHPVDVPAAQAAAEDHGVWLRPFRDLVYTMPPYVTPADDVARIAGAVVAAAAAG